MDFLKVLNTLSSIEQDSTKKIISEGKIDDLRDRQAAEKDSDHSWKPGTKEKPRQVKGGQYGGSKQKDDKKDDDLDESLQGVAEASTINGKTQSDEEEVWKQTSLTYKKAVEKYGRANVKIDGKSHQSKSIVLVKQSLVSEQGVAEALTKDPILLSLDYSAYLAKAQFAAEEGKPNAVANLLKSAANAKQRYMALFNKQLPADPKDVELERSLTAYVKNPNNRDMMEAKYDKDLDENKPVKVSGVKGMNSKSFTKKFRNMEAYRKWADSDAADDYDVKEVTNESVEISESAMGGCGMTDTSDTGVSISTNIDTRTGSKTINVSASGESAEELAEILKLSGLVGSASHEEHSDQIEIPLAQRDGFKMPEREVEETYSNEPNEVTQPVDVQLRQGTDLNREKPMYRGSYHQGDNPMAMREAEELARLESSLMEELNSIKVWLEERDEKMCDEDEDMEEGNEFSGELAKARAAGKKEFKVDGKSYQVKESAKNVKSSSSKLRK